MCFNLTVCNEPVWYNVDISLSIMVLLHSLHIKDIHSHLHHQEMGGVIIITHVISTAFLH